MSDLRISTNFTGDELVASVGYPDLSVPFDQLPAPIVVSLCRVVHECLQHFRDAFGPVRTTSVYRNDALNQVVGGHRSSRHLNGLAADFKLTRMLALDVFAMIAAGQSHATFDRLCLYATQNRLHVDLRPLEDGPGRSLFFTDNGSGWTPIAEVAAARLGDRGTA